MRGALLTGVLLATLPLAQAQRKKELDVATLGNVLYCLQSKVASIGYAPPRFSEHSFKLKYLLTTHGQESHENELQMVVYAPSDKKGFLYQVYFEEKDHHPIIFIGELGTLKREGKDMVPDEIWGGVGSYYEVKRLLRKLSSNLPVMVEDDQVREGPRTCVSQR